MIKPSDEQIKILAKQLKVPTFSTYQELLKQADSKATFDQLLYALMQREYAYQFEQSDIY